MPNGHKKWVEKPDPIEGESLSSWMIRTALANLNSLSSLLDYIQDYYIDLNIYDINKDYDLNWYYILLDIFSSKTRVSIETLKKMSLSYLSFKVDEITKVKEDISWRNNIFQELWFTKWKSMYGTGLRFCPLCLKEDKIPFFRHKFNLNVNRRFRGLYRFSILIRSTVGQKGENDQGKGLNFHSITILLLAKYFITCSKFFKRVSLMDLSK